MIKLVVMIIWGLTLTHASVPVVPTIRLPPGSFLFRKTAVSPLTRLRGGNTDPEGETEIDEGLYSRQLYVYGRAAQHALQVVRVKLSLYPNAEPRVCVLWQARANCITMSSARALISKF